MAPQQPPKKFDVQPVETSSRSSRDNGAEQKQEEKPAYKRFAPEPIEMSSKSSNKFASETGDLTKIKSPRKFLPQPVETTRKSSKEKSSSSAGPRKFAPEPVETTSKSSKDKKGSEGEKPKTRRFAPEPMETSKKSSRGRSQDHDEKPRRFAPQPVETTQTSSKDKKHSNVPHIRFTPDPFSTTHSSSRKQSPSEDVAPGEKEPERKAPRKFAPILLDTAQRSRRSSDNKPALDYKDRTEHGHALHAREHRRHIVGHATPFSDSDSDVDMSEAPEAGDNRALDVAALAANPELKRAASPLDGRPRPQSRFSERSHSFRLPDLDTIESSESEPASESSSNSSSLNRGSPITNSDSSFNDFKQGYKHATRIRESVDENFSHYLLQLEQKRAEERMREAALAAFPNSDYHEPVAHYVNDEEDTESEDSLEDRPTTWEGHEDEIYERILRRESTAKIPWEQLEMQRHAERMEQERNANKTTQKQPSESPWWQPGTGAAIPLDKDNEMKSMQDRARPPMLGNDIRFPRCKSPDPARFDVTQGSTVLRNQMCYLTEHAESESKQDSEEPGLWQGAPKPKTHFTSIKTPQASTKGTMNSPGGLWGGFCVDTGEQSAGLAPPSQPTGLMTPRVEHDANPFEASFKTPNPGFPPGNGLKTPPTPAGIQSKDLGTIDSVLVSEQYLDETMERDYPDSFVTQVYNYLSLGYPTLARPFDAELAKISRIPIADLRQDDQKAKQQPRGYIRLGPDFEGGGGEVKEDNCMRWQALKLYIREWARQEKNMVSVDGPLGNWGTGARRGSWGI